MTVKELIDILQILPQNYEVKYDAYDCGCLEGVEDVELKVKAKVVILKK